MRAIERGELHQPKQFGDAQRVAIYFSSIFSIRVAAIGRATSLPVHEVTNHLRVEPNHVYVIPPNRNLSITEGVLTLGPRPKTRTPNRSIDFFFAALAKDQRDCAIGVILSGTATDGTLGLEAIKARGRDHIRAG